jgi:hypothetical protein
MMLAGQCSKRWKSSSGVRRQFGFGEYVILEASRTGGVGSERRLMSRKRRPCRSESGLARVRIRSCPHEAELSRRPAS